MRLDDNAEKIIRRLESAGFEAYAVGGCVRDALMGIEPEDWDITTSARPEEVKLLFSHTFDTGIEHGTVTVLMGRTGYEVTTYRLDGKYSDHRRPDHVEYTASLYEDVARRDFTINSMAYHPDRGLVDYFGGRRDLEKKVIRCVGDPEKRFNEDALRMLRAVRFAGRLGFSIDPATREAAIKLAPTLLKVSRERVQEELTKMLTGSHPQKISMLKDLNLFDYLIPHPEDLSLADMEAPGKVEPVKALRFAAFLYPGGPDKCRKVLKELKFDNDTIKAAVLWTTHINDPIPEDEAAMRRLMLAVGKEAVPGLIQLFYAAGRVGSGQKAKLDGLYRSQKDAPIAVIELAVDGDDLIGAGIPKGKEVGRVLAYLQQKVVEDPALNTKERLIGAAKDHFFSAPLSDMV